MPPPVLRHDFVHEQLRKLDDHLGEIEHLGTVTSDGVHLAADSLGYVRRSIGDALERERPPEADYYSRAPIVSIVQSALDRHLEHKRELARQKGDKAPHEAAEAERVEHDDERMGDPFTRSDIAGWVGDIALSLIGRAIQGSHPFCDVPARADLPAQVRLVLIGDWGTGRKGAKMVGAQAQERLYERLGSAHLVHLGDNYYSGTELEARRNVLANWPVGPGNAAHLGSWCLNGNHDMYSGGHGLFETILGDPRFFRQRAEDGRATSWFHLRNDDWNVVALDTSWKNRMIEIEGGHVYVQGALGDLEGDGQLEVLRECARDDRRLLVLSHHQLFSGSDADHARFGTPDGEARTPLAEQVAPALGDRVVDAWFWGHEHDCLAYEPFGGVAAARAVGHSAVPLLVATSPARPLGPPHPRFLVTPDWREGDAEALRHVRWEYRDYRIGGDRRHWAKHGLAVLDLDGRDLRVTYVDDEGNDWLTETI